MSSARHRNGGGAAASSSRGSSGAGGGLGAHLGGAGVGSGGSDLDAFRSSSRKKPATSGRAMDAMGGGTMHSTATYKSFATSSVMQPSSSHRHGRGGASGKHKAVSSALAKDALLQRGPYDYLPEEFLYNPKQASPILHFLPKLLADARQQDIDVIPLDALLQAADEDIRLHRARVKAGMERDNRLVRTYQLEQDQQYQERTKRLDDRAAKIEDLEKNAETIVRELDETQESRGLTQAERTQLQLEKWQRALELYVHTQAAATSSDGSNKDGALDWQSVFEKLLDSVTEDQDISAILKQASDMCQELVTESQVAVKDAAAHVLEVETSYLVRLEAHQQFARSCLVQVGDIEDQFKSSGKAALGIGSQLEQSEAKRSQCEAASMLIRRWWLLETLAEQEAHGGIVDVESEVNGDIPIHQCKMDTLFTHPDQSLEASKALKSLRSVVRSRGANGGTSATSMRLDATGRLIARTSNALEKRLLGTFERVYSAGGTYDFSYKPRPGSIDWRELRSLARALMLFDSGRSLHKRYVDMVVENRLPELFTGDKANNIMKKTRKKVAKPKKIKKRKPKNMDDSEGSRDVSDEEESEEESEEDEYIEEETQEVDIDETRSQLSTLFHRVSEICTQEFELIARVFGTEGNRTDLLEGHEEMPLVVARALLQRVVSDPRHGLQARINDLLSGIDKLGDFEAGAKKLDTFVVVHEKAAGLFSLLKDAAKKMVPEDSSDSKDSLSGRSKSAAASTAIESLQGYLTSQELALSNSHRQGYINLELRMLHHHCCDGLDAAGCTLEKGPPPRPKLSLAEKGILEEYRAPVLPLHKESLLKGGLPGILSGPLKQAVLRQPLIRATDSLSRTRLMFGTEKRGGETTARVILGVYSQMCSFYGPGFLYPIMETLREMLPTSAPSQPPQLPFDEEVEAPDLGVPPAFWIALERVHSASKSFDRELWAEGRDNTRVWGTLDACGDAASLAIARDERLHFYTELERRGGASILQALDTLSAHIQWVLVTGGESMLATGGTRIFNQLTGQSGGPYAIPSGASLETPNSPAVKSLTYCLRVQFVHVQSALTAESLAKFWTALSMRLYDILVARLLQHYFVSTVGAVILSRDVEALRSVAMLAGTEHRHWDNLREILTLFMTPPDAIKLLLLGPEGDSSKGLFAKAGRDQCLVFLSRRNDYRYKTAAGLKKSGWATEMLSDLNVTDPTDGPVNIGLFAAGRLA